MDREPGDDDRAALADGLLGVVNGAFKFTQAHPWVLLLRQRPRAALLGAAVGAAIILMTLPLTGISLWFDWAAQVNRASDPAWPLVGASFSQYLPRGAAIVIAVGSIALAFVLPRRHAAAWLGILMIVGSPSLRIFGLLFLLPGMLVVRRELALLAALFVASYTFVGLWLAVGVVAIGLALGRWNPGWLEPMAASLDADPAPINPATGGSR